MAVWVAVAVEVAVAVPVEVAVGVGVGVALTGAAAKAVDPNSTIANTIPIHFIRVFSVSCGIRDRGNEAVTIFVSDLMR